MMGMSFLPIQSIHATGDYYVEGGIAGHPLQLSVPQSKTQADPDYIKGDGSLPCTARPPSAFLTQGTSNDQENAIIVIGKLDRHHKTALSVRWQCQVENGEWEKRV